MNNRTQRKLLVIDGEAFTGGVGIANQWRGNAEGPEHRRDMHFSVLGPMVAQFQAVFNDNWIKATGRVLNGAHHLPKLTLAGLPEPGVEIYEYLPTRMHSKILIVDNELVSVGSVNFDLRSFHLNNKASMNIYDRNFTGQTVVVF